MSEVNFGKNIKKIRSIKKLSQTKFAEIFDLTRSSVSAYEEERAEPKIEVIVRIADYYNLTVDSLINSDITVNEFYKFNIFDGDFNKSPNSKNDLLKSLSFIEIPVVVSFDLHSESLNKIALKAENKIQLPNFKENHLAILIDENSFVDIASAIKSNDIIIVDLNFKVEKGMKFRNRYWILKINNSLYVGEMDQLANGDLIYYSHKGESFVTNEKQLDFIFPVESLISNHYHVNEHRADHFKRIEFKLNDLYSRVSNK